MVNINLSQRKNIETEAKKYTESGGQQLVKFAIGATQQYQELQQQNEKARINNEITKMNIDIMKATDNWKTQYSSNPNSKEGRAALQDAYKNTVDMYSMNFDGRYKNEFISQANELLNKYAITNEGWTISQNKINTANQINDSIKNSLNEAYQTGRTGNVGQSAVNFETYIKNLRSVGNLALGEVETDKLLKNYKSDYFKSTIAGMIDTNPSQAMQYLDRKEIIEGISDPEEITQLKKMAMSRFGNISKENAIKELSAFSLKYGDQFNKAVAGDMSSGELLQFINGEGAGLSGNAKKNLMKMAGYTEEDFKQGNVYSDMEKASFANDLAIQFSEISEFNDNKTKRVVDTDKKVEELLKFQDNLYEMYADKKIDKSTFNNYNNLLLLPLQEKLTKSIGKNRWLSDQTLENGLKSIDDATTYLGNFLGSGESDTITALDFLGAGATGSAEGGRKLASERKKQNAEILYTDQNRAQIASMFYRNLHNIIQQDTGGGQSIVDLEDMPEEKRNAYLTQAAVAARNSFLISKYPQLAKEANMPEAVYESGRELAFGLLKQDTDRYIKPSISSNQKIQRDSSTGKYYIVEVNPKNNQKKVIRDLTNLEVQAYYGRL